jgi:hypothetical protein
VGREHVAVRPDIERLAAHRPGDCGVEAEVIGARRQLVADQRGRLAGLGLLESQEPIDLLAQRVLDRQQNPTPLPRAQPRPPRRSATRRSHGGIHVRSVADRHARDQRPVDRAVHLHAPAGSRWAGMTVDPV